MTRRICTLLTFFFTFAAATLCAQSKSAQQIMDDAARKIGSLKSITADYELTANGEHMLGTLVMAGDKFHLSSHEVMAWYDGKTQWSYSSDTNEVNIIEPSPEELVAINPFVIISSFRQSFSPTLLKSAPGVYKLRLTPKTKQSSQIKEATISLNSKSMLPVQLSVTLDNSQRLDINVKSIKTGVNYPHSTFVFTKKLLPKAEIVDLR